MTRPLEEIPEFLKNQEFCIIDLETTGGNHKHDKIIEIGLVKVENLEITGEMSFLVKPEINIPDFIQKLTSITPEKLEDAPLINEIIDDILEFIGDSILVAHNSSFDVPFLNSVLYRLGRTKLENKTLCTNLMSKYLVPNILNSNLNYMSRIFGIEHNKAHRALEDATATAHLLIRFLHIFIAKGISKINHLYYPRNKYELDRLHFRNTDDQSDLNQITKTLENVKTAALVTLKGDKGVLLASIPLESPAKQLSLVLDYLKDEPWQIVTIRLYGTLLESIFDMAVNYTKFSSDSQEKLLGFLVENYLPEKKLEPLPAKGKGSKSLSKELPQFVIVNHLIPEQMVVYPLLNLNPKSEIIFRFPGHQKKIFQYVKNQHKRFKFNLKGHRRANIAKQLLPFINSYLLNKFSEKDQLSDFYFFDFDKSLKGFEDLSKQINNFLAENPNPYDYPNKHI